MRYDVFCETVSDGLRYPWPFPVVGQGNYDR